MKATDKMKHHELQEMARQLNIKNWWNMNKQEMIDAINACDTEATESTTVEEIKGEDETMTNETVNATIEETEVIEEVTETTEAPEVIVEETIEPITDAEVVEVTVQPTGKKAKAPKKYVPKTKIKTGYVNLGNLEDKSKLLGKVEVNGPKEERKGIVEDFVNIANEKLAEHPEFAAGVIQSYVEGDLVDTAIVGYEKTPKKAKEQWSTILKTFSFAKSQLKEDLEAMDKEIAEAKKAEVNDEIAEAVEAE